MYEDSHLEADYEDRFSLPDDENDSGPSGFYPEECDEPCDRFSPERGAEDICERCGFDHGDHSVADEPEP